MKETLKPVTALLISVAILLTGNGLQGTLLPIRASLESFSTISIGFIGAAYFLGFTVGCIFGAELVKRVGHIRVFLAMTALASTTALIHSLILYPWVWVILRMLTGFCFAILFVVIESWINDRSTNQNRGIIFSTYVMITLTVQAIGQLMIMLYEPTGVELFAITSILITLAAIPIALSTSPAPEIKHTTKFNLKKLYKISPAAIIGCLFIGFANGSFWSLAPIFITTLFSDISYTAWFMVSAVIGGALSQWPIGFLSDKIGRRKVIVIIAFLGVFVASLIILSIQSIDFIGINILGAAWGAVSFPMYAVIVAHANDHADPGDYVAVSSGLLLMYGIGAIIGPLLSSLLMALTNASGLFVYIGAMHLLLALYLSYRIIRRDSSPTDDHISFNDALTATYTASQVYEYEEENTDEQAN
ncbi:MAG: MFS family permease [Woeseiaceae bacterium]|jgi:MFS family permease|tara:strand:+ start:1657 stop:2907 length:1251 start_codon:yes stop_codon:yes gene_type:complete